MLIGISADVHRDDAGHFVCEVMTDQIADGLDEQLGMIRGLYNELEWTEEDLADQKDAEMILEFLRGPMGHLVKWTFQ